MTIYAVVREVKSISVLGLRTDEKKMLLNVPVALRTLSVANSCFLRCPCAGQKFMTHLEDERKKDCRPEEERSW